MKRILQLTAVFLFCCSVRVSADDVGYWQAGVANFQVGDFYYKFTYQYSQWDNPSENPKTGNVVMTAYVGLDKDVTVPASVTYQGTLYPVVAIGDYATITTGDSEIFALGRSSIEILRIPESIKELERKSDLFGYEPGPFAQCSQLKEIVVDPSNQKYSSKDGVLFNKDQTVLWAYPPNHPTTDYTVPNTVTMIRKQAFQNSKIQRADLSSNTVRWIEEKAFENCRELTECQMSNQIISIEDCAFRLSALLEIDIYHETLENIGNYAFQSCSGMKKLSRGGLPRNLKHLGIAAFEYCRELVGAENGSIYIPSNITYISSRLFHHCDNLTSVYPNASTVSIGKMAFCACPKLSGFEETFPTLTNLETIGKGAFSTTPLKKVLLPESVKWVDDYAFGCNKDLTEFTIPTNCILGNGVLTNTPNLTKINNKNTTRYTLDKSGGLTLGVLYGNSDNAKDELVYFIPQNKIGDDNKEMVKQWIMPNSVKKICNGSMTFHRIESLILPSNLETIEDYAFARFIFWKMYNGDQPVGDYDVVQLSDEESNNWQWTLWELTIPPFVTDINMNAFFILKFNRNSLGDVMNLVKTTMIQRLFFMGTPGNFKSTLGGFIYDEEYYDYYAGEAPVQNNYYPGVSLSVKPTDTWSGASNAKTGEAASDMLTVYTTKTNYNKDSEPLIKKMKESNRVTSMIDYKIPLDRAPFPYYFEKTEYITMCRDFDMDFSNEGEDDSHMNIVSAYIATECTDKSAGYKMEKVKYIPARTGKDRDEYHGVIVKIDNYQQYYPNIMRVYYKMGEKNCAEADHQEAFIDASNGNKNPSSNHLVGVVANSHVQGKEGNLTNWGLSQGEWRPIVNQGRLTPYNRAYLQPTEEETAIMKGNSGQNAKVAMCFFDGFENEPTSIDRPDPTLNEEETGVWYQLDGRRVEGKPTAKGIYIHNGRKEVIK